MKKIYALITFIFVLLIANSSFAYYDTTTTENVEEKLTATETAERWVFDFIVTHAAPGRKLWYPNAAETVDEAIDRYESIAHDVVSVVYSPDFKPLFKDPVNGRSRTVSVILGIMFHESGFRKDVDLNLGKHSRGDNGQSWCMMQLMIGNGRTLKWNFVENRMPLPNDKPEHLFSGYTGDELISDRVKCISEGYKIVKSSFGSCWKLPLLDKLTSYASGQCDHESQDPNILAKVEAGRKKSRIRMHTALIWFDKTNKTRGFVDSDVVTEQQ
jgi:hypothetical protein